MRIRYHELVGRSVVTVDGTSLGHIVDLSAAACGERLVVDAMLVGPATFPDANRDKARRLQARASTAPDSLDRGDPRRRNDHCRRRLGPERIRQTLRSRLSPRRRASAVTGLVSWVVTGMTLLLIVSFCFALLSLCHTSLAHRPKTPIYDQLGRPIGMTENPDFHVNPGEDPHGDPDRPPA